MIKREIIIMDEIITKIQPTFYFIGVTTNKSSIMQVFPRWMDFLGRKDVVIEGVDHKIHDEPQSYRETVRQIKYDHRSLGGLVTTHKIDLLEASRDLFDELHESAILTGEVSSISKNGSKLIGHALDPLTSGLSMDHFLSQGYFGKTGGYFLCFGAGGSGKAMALHLIDKREPKDRPPRFVVVNRSQGRLDGMKAMVERLDTDIKFEYIQNSNPLQNDRIMGKMPPGSVVVNATGMGKDTPGSPVTDAGLFPYNGVAWEINYRGELDFWHQAAAQRKTRGVLVEDGWNYFLQGWTQVIAEVLHIDINKEAFNRLAEIAEELRPPLIHQPRKVE